MTDPEQKRSNPFAAIPIAGDPGPKLKKEPPRPQAGPRPEPLPELPPELPREESSPDDEPSPPAGRQPKRTFSRLLMLPAGLVIIYLFSAWVLFPLVAPTLLADFLGRRLDRPVTIAKANWQPFSLTLTLHNGIIGPKLSDPDDRIDPVLSFRTLAVDLAASSLFRQALITDEVRLDRLFVHLVRREDTSFNLLALGRDLLGERPDRARRFAINNISVSNSRLDFDDRAGDHAFQVSDLNLTLPALATLTQAAAPKLKPSLTATVNGSPIQLGGATTIRDGRLEARLDLQLKDIDLAAYRTYLPVGILQGISQGRGSVNCALLFTSESGQAARLEFDGTAELNDLVLEGEAGRRETLPTIRLTGLVAPLRGHYHFREIELQGPELTLVRRSPAQGWQLPLLYERWPTGANELQPEGKAGSPLPDLPPVTIDRLRIQNGRLLVSDLGRDGDFRQTWSSIAVSLENYPAKAEQTANFALSGTAQDGGDLSLQGQISAEQTEALLVLDNYPLAGLAPYGKSLFGAVDLSGRLELALEVALKNSTLTLAHQAKISRLAFIPPPGQESPLPLAVALLTDNEQSARLNFTLSGRLEPGGFSYGRELAATIQELAGKATANPISLLRQEFSRLPPTLAFAPGSAELSREAGRDLDQLAAALDHRPRLGLTLQALADPGCDRQAIMARKEEEFAARKRAAVADLVKELAKSIGRTGAKAKTPSPEPLRPETITVSAPELAALAASRLAAAEQRLAAALDPAARSRLRPGRSLLATPPAKGDEAPEPTCAARIEFIFTPIP